MKLGGGGIPLNCSTLEAEVGGISVSSRPALCIRASSTTDSKVTQGNPVSKKKIQQNKIKQKDS